MLGDGGELLIELQLHPRRWWLLVPMEVGEHTVRMVLDTGSPLSSISEDTYDALSDTDRIARVGRDTYLLRAPTIQEQTIADLRVRISRRVSRVGADGALGLDFLGRFTDVHFHVPSLRLTLS